MTGHSGDNKPRVLHSKYGHPFHSLSVCCCFVVSPENKISRLLRVRDLNIMSSETEKRRFLHLPEWNYYLSGRRMVVKRTGIDVFRKVTPCVIRSTLFSKLSKSIRHIPFTLSISVMFESENLDIIEN